MSSKPEQMRGPDRRTGERRQSQQPFEGPDRRVSERRVLGDRRKTTA